MSATKMNKSAVALADPLIDQGLGDYKLVKQLGIGALGTTYLAEHKFLKRPFVLKVLPDELIASRESVLRFEAHVRALSTLEHPNLLKMHNVSHADGKYFLVNEHKNALPLKEYLEKHKGPLSEQHLIDLARGLASGLDYIHSKSVGDLPLAHLSLKPGNVLITEERGTLIPILCDVGLASVMGTGNLLRRSFFALSASLQKTSRQISGDLIDMVLEKEQENKILSPEQAVSLTDHWIHLAPEWIMGQSKMCNGPKADCYAFGMILYFAMMREYPMGIFDLPSRRLPKHEMNWDLLITKCLSQSPNRRPDTLLGLVDELRFSRGKLDAPAQAPVMSAPNGARPWSIDDQKKAAKQHNEDLQAVSQSLTRSSSSVSKLKTVSVMVKKPEPIVTTTESIKQELSDKRMICDAPMIPPGGISYADAISTNGSMSAASPELQIKDSHVVKFRPKEHSVHHVEPILTEMIIVPTGIYSRGSASGGRDELPVHKVNLSSYAIDIHPVTNEQFVLFMQAVGDNRDRNGLDLISLRDSRIKRASGDYSIETGYAKHPVVGVSWYGAVAYAEWVGKRLPTEAEWEIAAYGGVEGSLYPTGATLERPLANFFNSDTTPVMSYPPNDYGLYDMAGNVYEWCEDWYDYTAYAEAVLDPTNPKGPAQGVYRVLRGGCWKSLKEDLRCTHRHRNNPRTMNPTYGFRCVTNT